MNIIKINRKNKPIFVRRITVGGLDKTKCSTKFLSHNLSDDTIVNVKCYEDGTLDLRGKKEEYRILVEDKCKHTHLTINHIDYQDRYVIYCCNDCGAEIWNDI